MPLTEKEKRIITSPQSFLSRQRKTTKFRTRKKIQEVLCDMQFLIENYSKISDMFGIDVLVDDISSKKLPLQKTEKQASHKDESSDPDLL